eukprot:13942085-Alexandrium_andersonii.AAC.1
MGTRGSPRNATPPNMRNGQASFFDEPLPPSAFPDLGAQTAGWDSKHACPAEATWDIRSGP